MICVRRLDIAFKLLQIIALTMVAFSIFLPWVSESGVSPLAIYPPLVVNIKYWTYQSVTNTNGYTTVSTFQGYWQSASDFRHSYASKVWFLMFVLQILTIALESLSVVRENVKRHSILFVGAILTLSAILILGFRQFNSISQDQGLNYHQASIEIGFWLALFSLILIVTAATLTTTTSARASSKIDQEPRARGLLSSKQKVWV